ncbi:hypothetical protein [Helicobacter pylori]|uniref:hypothetical protein n=1 Tax=Helicobacter pylori TaxID=210 RepID=UPI0011C46092|nr:hypothetical protein [Helicobacter pylori]
MAGRMELKNIISETLNEIEKMAKKIQKNGAPFKHDALLERHYLNFIKGDRLSVENLEQWLVEWN